MWIISRKNNVVQCNVLQIRLAEVIDLVNYASYFKRLLQVRAHQAKVLVWHQVLILLFLWAETDILLKPTFCCHRLSHKWMRDLSWRLRVSSHSVHRAQLHFRLSFFDMQLPFGLAFYCFPHMTESFSKGWNLGHNLKAWEAEEPWVKALELVLQSCGEEVAGSMLIVHSSWNKGNSIFPDLPFFKNRNLLSSQTHV